MANRRIAWWAIWILGSALCLWFFAVVALVLDVGGIFSTPTTATRVQATIAAAIGCAGPVLFLLPLCKETSRRRVVAAAVATAIVGGFGFNIWR